MFKRTEPGGEPDLLTLWRTFDSIEKAVRAHLHQQQALTEAERESEFDRLSLDLRRAYALRFMAAAEGAIRLSFLDAHRLRRNDPWGSWWHTFAANPHTRLDDILDSWKTSTPQLRALIGSFSDLLSARHWLAHGQTWTIRMGREWDDPYEIWSVCYRLSDALK